MRKGLLTLLVFLSLVGQAFAVSALDLSTVTVDTAPVFVLAVTIITALAAVWVIRKAIKLTNRS
jgi:prophage maintenance system killer protein